MNFAAADLHCHTTASDGAFPPGEVVRLALGASITTLAITDHDTVAGHAEAIAAAAGSGLRVIPGIEVSSLARGGEVHVLGLGVRGVQPGEKMIPARARALSRIDALREARDARARKMLSRLDAHGIRIDFAHVRRIAGDAMVGRPHIARALVETGAAATTQQAFDLWIGEGKPGFSPHEGLTPADAIGLIHAAGGVAVLAHPALFAGELSALLDDVIASGVDGIEVYHPSADDACADMLRKTALRHGLLVTGGSDFHGSQLENTQPIGTCRTPADMLARLDERMGQRQRESAVAGL